LASFPETIERCKLVHDPRRYDLLHLELRGEIETSILARAAKQIREEDDSGELQVGVIDEIESEHFFSVPEGAAIVQCIALLAKAVVFCYKEIQQRRKWDKNRLLTFVEQELLKRGVTDYIIDEIQDFECLLGSGNCPCRVTVLSATSSRGYSVLVFRNGDSFAFELQARLGLL
jgi:hypothetical protein